MRHDIVIEGHAFRLRPVSDDDAPLILELRTDKSLGRFLHPTTPSLASQLAWLSEYYRRPGDYYFVVERRDDCSAEGLVAIYDLALETGVAEWGRWILKPQSVGAVESVALVYRCAFEILCLTELYCRTVASNEQVVAFHESAGAKVSQVLKEHFSLYGQRFDAIEHRVNEENWRKSVGPYLDRISMRIARRISGA